MPGHSQNLCDGWFYKVSTLYMPNFWASLMKSCVHTGARQARCAGTVNVILVKFSRKFSHHIQNLLKRHNILWFRALKTGTVTK